MLKLPVRISAIVIFCVIVSLSSVWLSAGALQSAEDPSGPAPNRGELPPVPPSGEVAPGGGPELSPDDITQPLSEGFEGGTLGQFVSVVAACVPGGCGWKPDSVAHTGAYAAMAPDVNNISDQQLTLINAVAIPATATAAQLTFWHRYAFEALNYDGGVLEVSTNGGATWADAGANIISGGYNGTISSCCSNPLAGRSAWIGGPFYPAYGEVKVNLLPYAGQNLLIRFRLGTDSSFNATGWWIDDIVITIAAPTPCTTPVWTQMAPYPIPIMDQATAVLGGQLFSFSGVSNGAITPNSYQYNPATNNWTAIAPLPQAREAPRAVSDGTFVYILGGWDGAGNLTTSLYRYDPLSNTYATLAPYTTATSAHAAVYMNGKIYRIGGCSGNCAPGTNTVEVYTIASNTWGSVANLPAGAAWLMASAHGGYIYAAGGMDSGGDILKTYRYDPNLNTWDDVAIADLPAVRWGAASDFIDGKWVISGGYVNAAVSASAIAWDPITNAWSSLADMLQARARMTGGAIGPAYYNVGGRDPSGSFNGNVDNQRYLDVPCERCQATNWVVAQPYPQTIVRYAFGQVGDDFYIFGGVSGGAVVNTARRYNAVSNTWVDLAPVPAPGEAPSAAYWNGKVYVTQGSSGNGFQIYDIASNSWGSGASIPASNSYGSALGAYNGLVYLVGGGASPSATTYIYTISSNSWSSGTNAPAQYQLGGYTQVGQYLYLVGSYGTSPLDVNTGLPASSLQRADLLSEAAPEANSAMTMRLDLAAGTWSTGPAWTPARADFALASDGVKLYAIGGDTTGGSYFDSNSEVDEYLLANWPSGAWITSPPNLPSPHQANQAGFYSTGRTGGEIWSTGGLNTLSAFLNDHLYRATHAQCHTDVCPGPTTISGSLDPSDLVASQRLFRDGVPGTCALTGSCSVLAGTYHYDQYPLVNNTGVQQCLTISGNTACTGTNMIFVGSYNGSFDPNNVCTNWIEDMGSSPNPSGSYSHLVAPGQSIVVVVEEVTSGGGCPGYDLVISADSCAVTSSPTPTATSTPTPTSTATPTPTATSTPTPTSTATATPTATSTPTPTSTATVTPTQPAPPLYQHLYLPIVLNNVR